MNFHSFRNDHYGTAGKTAIDLQRLAERVGSSCQKDIVAKADREYLADLYGLSNVEPQRHKRSRAGVRCHGRIGAGTVKVDDNADVAIRDPARIYDNPCAL